MGNVVRKDFMAFHDFVETLPQCHQVERSIETDGGGKIIDGAARVELIDEPQSLLSKGERQFSVSRNRHNGRRMQSRPAAYFNDFSQSGNGGRLEQSAQRHLHLEGFADSGNDLSCQQRMSA